MNKNKLIIKLSSVTILIMLLFTGLIFTIQYNIYKTQAFIITDTVRSFLIVDDIRSAKSKLSEGLNFYQSYRIRYSAQDYSEQKITEWPNLTIKQNLVNVPNGEIEYGFSFKYTLVYVSSLNLLAIIFFIFILRRELKLIEENYNLNLERNDLKTRQEVLAKISHDIRSPLAVLEALVSKDGDDGLLIRSAINRLQDIAENILDKRRKILKNEPFNIETFIKTKIIEKSLAQNELFLSDPQGISNIVLEKYLLTEHLSNLLNNSIEATNNIKRRIQISLTKFDTKYVISIKDNGHGFPDSVINNFGQDQLSVGKVNGNGIGLYQLMKDVKRINANVKITNLSPGAEVLISIPRVGKSILVDDDELIRLIWEMEAKKKGIDLIIYTDPLEINVKNLDFETSIYIDSNLKNGQKGEEFAQSLFDQGYKNLILTTGYELKDFKHLTFLKNVIGKNPPW